MTRACSSSAIRPPSRVPARASYVVTTCTVPHGCGTHAYSSLTVDVMNASTTLPKSCNYTADDVRLPARRRHTGDNSAIESNASKVAWLIERAPRHRAMARM
jgi:hypothetical protein